MAGGTSSFQTGFGGAPGHIFKTHKPGLFWENWAGADLYLCTDSTKLLSKC